MTLIQKMATVLVVSLVIGFIAKSYAEPVNAGNLTIDNTFTRATVPGQKNAGGFLSIANKGADDKLISATSNVASEVQIHEMKMDGNVMQMKQTADRLFGDDYVWSVLGAGRHQMATASMSVILGGNARVGLEDSLWDAPGQLAHNNAQQVQRIRSIIEALSLEVATPDEAREILQLKGAANVGF